MRLGSQGLERSGPFAGRPENRRPLVRRTPVAGAKGPKRGHPRRIQPAAELKASRLEMAVGRPASFLRLRRALAGSCPSRRPKSLGRREEGVLGQELPTSNGPCTPSPRSTRTASSNRSRVCARICRRRESAPYRDSSVSDRQRAPGTEGSEPGCDSSRGTSRMKRSSP